MSKNIYDEFIYWNRREEPSSAPEDYNIEHLSYIKKHLDGMKYILDFGPGTGRTLSAYENVKSVVGCDISTLYSEKVLDESKKYSFEFQLDHTEKPDDLSYQNKEFDAVVSCTVFLHCRPEKIIGQMKELIRVGKKVITVSKYDEEMEFDIVDEVCKDKCRYNFNYNYYKICEDNNWEVLDPLVYKRHLFFVYKNM